MNYYGLTFIGRRSSNQDSFYCGRIAGITLLVVADGMGGMKGGEIASQIALEQLTLYLKQNIKQKSFNLLKEVLNNAIESADNAIAKYAVSNPDLNGMGTTLSCVLLSGNKFICGNIGDSRIYLLSKDRSHQITVDHTYLQEYINDFGVDVPEEILKKGHILTKSLNGAGDKPDIYPSDTDFFVLEPSEFLLLCSDGIINDKSGRQNEQIKNSVFSSVSLKTASEQLISEAYLNGSRDNCTVILCTLKGVTKPTSNQKLLPFPPDGNNDDNRFHAMESKKKSSTSVKLILALVGMIFLGFTGYLYVMNKTDSDKKVESQITETVHEPLLNTTDESDELAQSAFDWETGFAGINTSIPYTNNESISWAEPASQFDHFILRVIQNGIIVYEFETEQSFYVLGSNHEYISGELKIELSAIKDGQVYQPKYRSTVIINYVSN